MRGRTISPAARCPATAHAECVLRRDVAEALAQVQADLARENLSLKIYDCYRPTRAVRAFMRWANDGARDSATKRFYPTLEKRTLFTSGYIAAHFGAFDRQRGRSHARRSGPQRRRRRSIRTATYGPCTGPMGERAPDT